MKVTAAVFAAGALLAWAFTTIEGAGAILFGWVGFLWRVLPSVKPDEPSVIVGGCAAVLFVVGVHWTGRVWRPGWTVHSTVAVAGGVVLLFAAGVTAIGIVHQVAWLTTSNKPLVGQCLKRETSAAYNLKEMSIGLANFQSVFDRYPSGGTFAPDGRMLHSWETEMMPWMVYSTHGIDFKKPWNDPVNAKYFRCVIREFINPIYRTPELEDADGFGLSHYAANSRVMAANTRMKLADIKDGPANTILIGEVNASFRPWGHPLNWRDPAVGFNRPRDGFGGPSGTRGANFVMADGSVRFVSDRADPAVLKALATPAAGDDPGPAE